MRLTTGRVNLLLVLGLASGCGGSKGPQLAEVHGFVTLDGEQVTDGSINFLPKAGVAGPTSGTSITNGQFRMPIARGAALGENAVQIIAHRKTGRRIADPNHPGQEMDEVSQHIPAKYNDKSELVRTVAPGTNNFNFALTSD